MQRVASMRSRKDVFKNNNRLIHYTQTNYIKNMRTLTYGVAVGNLKSPTVPYVFIGNFTENIKKARIYGYDAVELHIRDPKDIKVNQIVKQCDRFNIEISCISTGLSYHFDKLSLTDYSEIKRKEAIIKIKEYIDLAILIGGSVTIGTIRGNIPPGSSYNEHEKRFCRSLEEILEYAVAKSVTLLIETANRYETNFLNKAEKIFELIDKNNFPMLKIHIDTFHMNIEEVNIGETIKKISRLLGYFHIADSNRMYPSAGHIDFVPIVSALKDIQYSGYIVVECLPVPNSNTAAKKSIDFMKSIFRDY